MLNLKDMIHHFVEHRHEVVVRRTTYELRKAEERAHILEGLIIASDNIDEVIAIIRGSSNADQAREKLIERFKLSEIQSKAIVEMRLRQLTGLEQDKLRGEYDAIMKTIEDLILYGRVDVDISLRLYNPFRAVATISQVNFTILYKGIEIAYANSKTHVVIPGNSSQYTPKLIMTADTRGSAKNLETIIINRETVLKN